MASETTRPQAETRTITVKGQRLRVAIRKGDGTLESVPSSNCKASRGCAQKCRICFATFFTPIKSISANIPPFNAATTSGAPCVRT